MEITKAVFALCTLLQKQVKLSAQYAGLVFYTVALAVLGSPLQLVDAGTLPANFQNSRVIGNLTDPDGFEFSPDGRMFISERITGKLLLAKQNQGDDNWVVQASPFHTFLTPRKATGVPQRHRSAGLRDIAFDPDFTNNGFIYVFYMHADSLQNRVVRIKASETDPDISDAEFGEELLIELPFNSTTSSGSHNGGALEFGLDGKLYISTGDGWTGQFAGDSVQTLDSFTGKILRINTDGTIPTDNPFYNQAIGDYRAVYSLGLRNPFSMTRHPVSGKIYINDARGHKKADIYIVEAAANYGHQGSSIGNLRLPWANASAAGSELNTGGAWYPVNGPFPPQYHGAYFVALWGGNGDDRGQISIINSETDTSVEAFELDVGHTFSGSDPIKPVVVRIGPQGNVYYMETSYETTKGTIQKLHYTGQATVGLPQILPGSVSSPLPVTLSMITATDAAQIYYTFGDSLPTQNDNVYVAPITITETTTVNARAYKTGYNPSSLATAVITIQESQVNLPPVVDAGPDKSVVIGALVVLDGSGSTDPDGDDAFLTEEIWSQLSGPPVQIIDATEEVAYVTPMAIGTYVFQLSMSDSIDTSTDEVVITVGAANLPPVLVDDDSETYAEKPVTFSVLANDIDESPGLLEVTSVSQPKEGNAVVNGDNSITYTPAPGFIGVEQFFYTASDGVNADVTAVVTITVLPIPDMPPIAIDDYVTTDYETDLIIEVLLNDIDESMDSLSITTVTQPLNGTAIINQDNTITYSPDALFKGSDQFTYTISDGVNQEQTALVAVEVLAMKTGKEYVYISSTTSGAVQGQDGQISFRDEDVIRLELATGYWELFIDNSDVGFASDISAFSILVNGSALLSPSVPTSIRGVGMVDDSDIVLFTPVSTGLDTSGVFSLYFDGSDVGLSTNGERLAAIHSLENGDLILSTTGNFSVPGLSGDDSDLFMFKPFSLGSTTQGNWQSYIDGADLGLNLSSEDIWGVSVDESSGAIYLNTNGALDVPNVSATPADITVCNSIGCDLALYQDGQLVGIGSENIDALHIGADTDLEQFNRFPVAYSDAAITFVNQQVEINVLSNDFDADGDELSVAEYTQTVNGDLTDNGDGTLLYMPDFGFSGTDSFTYQASDGEELSEVTAVEVIVKEKGDIPTYLYVSSTSNGTVGSGGDRVSFRDEDILRYEIATDSWSLFLDMSDMGVYGDVDGFSIQGDGSILISLTGPANVPSVGLVDDSDLLKLIPTSTGASTAGSIELYFDGSDVELTSAGEDIDSVAQLQDSLLFSTANSFLVENISGSDRQLLEFSPGSLGVVSAGSWSDRFIQSTSELDTSSEDVWAMTATDDASQLFFSTSGNFNVNGVTGTGADIIQCDIVNNDDPQCDFSIFQRGADIGFSAENIDAMHLQ